MNTAAVIRTRASPWKGEILTPRLQRLIISGFLLTLYTSCCPDREPAPQLPVPRRARTVGQTFRIFTFHPAAMLLDRQEVAPTHMQGTGSLRLSC